MSGLFSVNQSGWYGRGGKCGGVKALGFGVELLDVGMLVPMSDHEFADLLKRYIVGMTPGV